MRYALVALTCAVLSSLAPAQVQRLEIRSRHALLGGRAFGDVGAYEELRGKVHFALDPKNPRNVAIVDLPLAKRNDDGLVEARADFRVLRPVDPKKGNGTALLEVSNRGGMASLRHFHARRGEYGQLGDAFLMRRGYTVIWVGWQWDVPRGLRLDAPVAVGQDGPIEGLVRSDWPVDRPSRRLRLGDRRHRAYRPIEDHADNVLTVRDGRDAKRHIVPREKWKFVLGDIAEIELEGGFTAGRIYELVYRSRNPRVVGLGLAAVRDMMSYAKHDESCPFPVKRGIATGISQTGRFLRHFLYQGFNVDPAGRKVFDGIIAQVAGAGRGSFNHRFGQASCDAHRYYAFFFPTDVFPYSSRSQRDAQTGQEEGLLDRQRELGHMPKFFQVNSGYEYWGRAASLIHTAVDGRKDVAPVADERIYHIASTQHYVGRFPRRGRERRGDGVSVHRSNPVNWRLPIRAFLVAMEEWIRDAKEPPPSTFPKIADGTLVPIGDVRFPKIPGVIFPKVIHTAYRTDYGPKWPDGIVTIQPPKLGPTFPTLVSQVDTFGNEVAGLRCVEVRAPLATYTPWSLRPDGELKNFTGLFIPLPRTEAEREKTGDPRPSIEKTHGTREAYLAKARAAAKELTEARYLLPEDIDTAVRAAATTWDLIHRPN